MKSSFDIWVVQLAYQVINLITTLVGIIKVMSDFFNQAVLAFIICFKLFLADVASPFSSVHRSHRTFGLSLLRTDPSLKTVLMLFLVSEYYLARLNRTCYFIFRSILDEVIILFVDFLCEFFKEVVVNFYLELLFNNCFNSSYSYQICFLMKLTDLEIKVM